MIRALINAVGLASPAKDIGGNILMRRIKTILAVVAAVATMMVLAAPAMAQTFVGGTGGTFDGDFGSDGGFFLLGSDGFNDLGDLNDLSDGGSTQFCICPGANSVSFD
jgi:hypothetical protein